MAGAREWLRRLIAGAEDSSGFDVTPDSTGLNFQADEKTFSNLCAGKGDELALVQMAILKQLEEQGLAESIYSGFFVASEFAVQLEREVADVLRLPPAFDGAFEARVSGNTRQAAFNVKLTPVFTNGTRIEFYELKGPFLSFSSTDKYLLNPGQYQALAGLEEHSVQGPDKSIEEINLRLVHTLQSARNVGFEADLSHFDELSIHVPDKIGLTVDVRADGGLELTPNLNCGLAPDDVAGGLGQALVPGDTGSIRVGKSIVLLDKNALDAVRHVIERRHVSPGTAADFFESPSMHLDCARIDLDDGFSKRVKGAGVYTFCNFGSDDQKATSWFGPASEDQVRNLVQQIVRTPEDRERLLATVRRAKEQGATELVYEGTTLPISDAIDLENIVKNQDPLAFDDIQAPESTATDSSEQESNVASVVLKDQEDDRATIRFKEFAEPLDDENLARKPFPHQLQGIRWLLSLRNSDGVTGGLLADDMGLGKTYMTLVAIQQWMLRSGGSSSSKPSLIVAPLALMENWEEEVLLTFKKSPFKDIVVLQSARDLPRFRVEGGRRETLQNVEQDTLLEKDEIAYALKIGDGYLKDRLDVPGRLVVTTYQALASYQFSLCRIDWDFVVFDEAQNLKNLNTLQTRAAKGLKAQLKVVATGTPVENSLSDFWCLVDTAQPGLLPTEWSDFNEQYIRPIAVAESESLDSVRADIGKQLRDTVGNLMLRRLKEDALEGLPRKTIYSGRNDDQLGRVDYDPKLAAHLSGVQLNAYDDAVDRVRSNLGSGPAAVLQGLADLRAVSIHPRARDSAVTNVKDWGGESVKIQVVEQLVRDVQARGEKVIIFLINKMLQVRLKLWLEANFGIQVEIVNGDTKATSKNPAVPTRKRIVDSFQTADGFGVLIMSPIAAGVGLTITGANNVIHLERHWNPAKEAQATDRVYRIGAEKDVNVYLPIVHHPEFDSFEVSLDRLLSRKMDLKDAVVTVDDVDSESIVQGLGL